MESLVDCLRSPATPNSHRTALLYVLHELLLTCSRQGTPEEAKQQVVLHTRRLLLPALEVILSGNGSNVFDNSVAERVAFLVALEKVIAWWGALRLFPAAWMDELQKLVHSSAVSREAETSLSVKVQRLGYLMAQYEQVKTLQLKNQSADSSPATDRRRLLATIGKYLQREFPSSTELHQWLLQEQSMTTSRETGCDRPAVGGDSVRVKIEGDVGKGPNEEKAGSGAVLPAAEDDDVLGSFFE